MAKRGKVLAVLAGAGVLLAAGVAFASGGGSGGRTDRPVRPGPGGRGKIFGGGGGGGSDRPPGLPADFDFAGNQIWISPDCSIVVEGERFWQADSTQVNAEERPTLAATLAIPDNSVIGFVDHLINDRGFTQPEETGWQILSEINPFCADMDPELWGEGLAIWWQDFVGRLSDYLDENVRGIGSFGDE